MWAQSKLTPGRDGGACRHPAPLALFEGNNPALYFDLDVYGLSVIEHGAGVVSTAHGMLADFIRAACLSC